MTLFDEPPHQEVRKLVFQQRAAASTVRTSWMARPAPGAPHVAIPGPPGVPAEATSALEPADSSLLPREPSAAEPSHDATALAALEQEVRKRMNEQSAMLARLERSIEELAAVRSSLMAATEKQLAELAGAIAKRALSHELTLEPSLILGLARQGIEALTEGDKLVVRVGAPLREATLATFFESMKGRTARCDVRHDPSLAAGQCIVETELGRVDESVDTRLANILEQLLPTPETTP